MSMPITWQTWSSSRVQANHPRSVPEAKQSKKHKSGRSAHLLTLYVRTGVPSHSATLTCTAMNTQCGASVGDCGSGRCQGIVPFYFVGSAISDQALYNASMVAS